ncbi:MAG TPA: hypothetical protein VEQ85_09350 [Lacipirellulaceae bacterium]|nr:hypothetical protein [Lacipirellulaceae bacterium]
MPIHVICPTCHARFKVGDQHAGKAGACPKCKGQIQIPASSEEVVIHEPVSEAGAKDAKGRNVLKPIKRKETKFQLNLALIIGGAALLTFAIAFFVGRQSISEEAMTWFKIAGAVLLGPPLAYAGYSFLRDDEQGAFVGQELLVRSMACGLAYALFWGVYWYVGTTLFDPDDYAGGKLELFQAGILAGIALGLGTFTAFVAFDFEPITGFFHFALYFGVTILLRAVMLEHFLPGVSVGGASRAPAASLGGASVARDAAATKPGRGYFGTTGAGECRRQQPSARRVRR